MDCKLFCQKIHTIQSRCSMFFMLVPSYKSKKKAADAFEAWRRVRLHVGPMMARSKNFGADPPYGLPYTNLFRCIDLQHLDSCASESI